MADSDDGRSFYALLGVSPTATEDEIRRAYRQLATALHPDKVRNAAQHDEASELFTRIQEAYEVLSDPQKRDIYDVYGKEGLAAGLQVGDRVRTREELRAEWEAFQAQQKKEALEAQVNYRGVYVFKADATALVRPYDPALARIPELTSIYMTSGLDVPLESRHWGVLGSEQDVAHLGGLVNVRHGAGGGSFLAGYKRAFADYSTLEVHGAVGLRTLLSAQHSVQLSPDSTAALVATWQPQAGVGLQFVTTRQLSSTVSGEYSWVVGPPEAAGMSLGLTRRVEKLLLAARLEVGAATGLVCRAVRQLGGAATARCALKLGTAGAELDVGATKRFSEVATGGCAVNVGMQGITLKLRYNRAGHLFEFPVLLTPNPLDWPVLAAAYLAPPLLYFAARDLVVGPLRRRIDASKAAGERRRRAADIGGALALARSAAQLLAPVASRRLAREHGAGGIVVVLALYGEERAVLEAAQGAPQRMLAARSAAAAGAVDAAEAGQAQQPAAGAALEQQQQEGGQRHGQEAAAGEAEAVPPPVADVTVAVQYMAQGGRVVFHTGYPKSGLMGFCDPSPAATKLLLVFFTFKGRPYRAAISDSEGASLPGRGVLLDEEGEGSAVAQLAEALGCAAAGGGGGGGPPGAAPSGAALGGELWWNNPSFAQRGEGSGGGLE